MSATALFLIAAGLAQPLRIEGAFIEACTCKGTCQYEVSGVLPGCAAVVAYRIDSGSFGGTDIAGVRVGSVATKSGALFIYIDSPPARSTSAKRLAMALFKDFGTPRGVYPAKISVAKSGDAWKLEFDGGKIASVVVAPVKGGDGKAPVEIRNVFGDPYDHLYQGRVKRGQFGVKGHEFKLEGTSAYFIPKLVVRKSI